MRTLALFLLSVALLIHPAVAQTPIPIVVPAATPTAPILPVTTAQDSGLDENINLLRDLKAANEDILKQQQATLDALDQLINEAEQLRIFSKRG